MAWFRASFPGATFNVNEGASVTRRSGNGGREAAFVRAASVVALVTLVLAAACTGDEPSTASETSTEGPTETVLATDPRPELAPTVEELPDPVAETREAIQAAASALDYDALEQLVEAEGFLSDAGFGVDPVTHWRELGTEPLKAMAVLLAMPHTVEETNEGTLYRWPRFTADSNPEDMSTAEKDVLTSLLGESGLEAAFLPETGYTAPRLGILADGTWWFLILEAAP